jgi:hypothetical protein
MHFTVLTLLAAGASASFVQSFVPEVAHAYGLEEPGKWHQIDNNNLNQHQATPRPTATPSTMISMVKQSIKPMASSFPWASGMFASDSAAPSQSHGYAHVHHHHATPSSNSHYLMASATPTHRPSHGLHLHQAPTPSASPSPAGHGPAVAPDQHIGVPAGGMGVPPSAEAPEPLNAAPESDDDMANAGRQSDIAPIDPMAPGTNVAPVQVHDKFGADKGNSFCLGQCFASPEEAQCQPPYVSIFPPVVVSVRKRNGLLIVSSHQSDAVLQSEGCYSCCFSPNEDF